METNSNQISDIQTRLKKVAYSEQIQSPKVSIIVPTYNNENYLAKCLFSLVEQTLKDIEIIVVNDGSTDNTTSILEVFAQYDKRFKIITQANLKQGSARNNGIELATGEFIGFVDSDDWVELNYFEELYKKATENKADVATTNILKHRKPFRKYNIRYNKTSVATSKEDKFKLCEDKKRRFFYVMNKIIKTSFIKDNNILFPEGCCIEDVMFSTKVILLANKIVSVPKTKYHYRKNPQSTINSKNNKKEKVQNRIVAYTELHKYSKEHNIELPERLNYTKSYWQGPFLKIYSGTFKEKLTFLGLITLKTKRKDL